MKFTFSFSEKNISKGKSYRACTNYSHVHWKKNWSKYNCSCNNQSLVYITKGNS